MTTRTKQLLQRSRDLLERSRVAAVQLLDPPRGQAAALPRVIEGTREPMIHQEPEGAVVDICASIALRDLNLVDSLLSLLEAMEESEADPDRLAELYKLDHLAARLRRNAENLRVLAGRDASDAVSDSASLVDIIRAAMSSIDAYSRVSIGRVLPLGVVGIAADDLSRLLAELLDNGAKQSPPDTSVRVSAHLTDSGSVLMRIEDDGIGLPPERVAELNSRLSDEPRLNDDSVRHMGLAVVRRLAARHDMRVRLDRRSPHGTTVIVLLPPGLLCELPDTSWSGSQTVARSAPAAHRTAAEPVSAPLPAARRPAARPRHAAPSTTAGGLPKRTPVGGQVGTVRPPQPADLTEGATTANGLPRRVSRSIKNPDGDSATGPAAAPPDPTPEEEHAGHEQLLADLEAFAAGEEAARTTWPEGSDPDVPPAPAAPVASAAAPAEAAEAPVAEAPVEPAAEPVAEAPAPAPQAYLEQADYAPDDMFDADADSTPTPPHGFPLPVDTRPEPQAEAEPAQPAQPEQLAQPEPPAQAEGLAQAESPAQPDLLAQPEPQLPAEPQAPEPQAAEPWQPDVSPAPQPTPEPAPLFAPEPAPQPAPDHAHAPEPMSDHVSEPEPAPAPDYAPEPAPDHAPDTALDHAPDSASDRERGRDGGVP